MVSPACLLIALLLPYFASSYPPTVQTQIYPPAFLAPTRPIIGLSPLLTKKTRRRFSPVKSLTQRSSSELRTLEARTIETFFTLKAFLPPQTKHTQPPSRKYQKKVQRFYDTI
ncbi:hypothetical protein M501DRAFT_183662 [Patellaria atrata CBS 101060]|uniref:Uncharacterized protein n=1 Tax=Patellaria atrata CBS 101060 TaxID=1346257 RepID=A0A9P4VPT9_9PEZI|nr:hypothetical protein M501DRAFT_183662 [Patellaria atrata CBS 101060]